jgi:hypothetical protein
MFVRLHIAPQLDAGRETVQTVSDAKCGKCKETRLLWRILLVGLGKVNVSIRLELLLFLEKQNVSRTQKGKGKAVPIQAWSGPEGSTKLSFPDYKTTALDGGKVVSLTHRPTLLPGNAPGTHFCQRLSRSQGHSAIGRIVSLKNSNDTTWNRTSDFPICRTVP